MKQLVLIGVLTLAVAGSAMTLVLSRHEGRVLFIELQELRGERDRLDEEWGQLLLEEATWGTHGRVEQIAREKLKMRNPGADRIFGVQL